MDKAEAASDSDPTLDSNLPPFDNIVVALTCASRSYPFYSRRLIVVFFAAEKLTRNKKPRRRKPLRVLPRRLGGAFWPFGHYPFRGNGGGPLDIEQVMVQLEVGLQYKLAGNELDLASLEQGSTRFIIPPAFHPMPQTAPGTLRPPGG